MNQLGKVVTTQRGFELLEWNDLYGVRCQLQQSSCIQSDNLGCPGTSAIWLGVAPSLDLPTVDHLPDRMHLNRRQVALLILHLQQWLNLGTFELEQP